MFVFGGEGEGDNAQRTQSAAADQKKVNDIGYL
jgi:hypothetical protein